VEIPQIPQLSPAGRAPLMLNFHAGYVSWTGVPRRLYELRPLKNGFGECERSFGEFKFDEAG
jgi:hypothetical protein